MERQWCRVAAVVLSAVLISASNGSAGALEIATVVKTGDPAPGAGSAVFDQLNGPPVVNGAGEVAFLALLAGSGVTPDNGRGIWAGPPDALALVAREGDPAPGTGGAVFDNIPLPPVLNGAGEVAFLAFLASTSDFGHWVGRPGSLTLAVRLGDPAPGAGGAVFNGFSPPLLNGAGELAFLGFLAGSGVTPLVNDLGIWAGRPRHIDLAARLGDPAPGTGGAVFSGLSGPAALNGAGELVFMANLIGAGVNVVNGRGLWRGAPGDLALAVRSGDRAPGADDAVFDSFSSPVALNGAGQLAFGAALVGSGVDPGINDQGVWAGMPGGLALVARSGDVAPGAGGAVFEGFGSRLLNGSGEVAFRGFLRGSGVGAINSTGLWAGRPEAIALAARGGDPAPGAGGAVFRSFLSPSLNGAGELAFSANLTGSGVTDFVNDTGLWAGPPDNLQIVVREGDAIEIAPGVSRTVRDSGLSLTTDSGNEDGRRSGLSEGGQTAFAAAFTDGSNGAFLSPPDAPKVHRLPHRPVAGAWDKVILPQSFEKPVLIAGPPSFRDKAPGVVRLRRIDGARGRFEARFQEWRYLDGKHPVERADFLVMEKGRHKQADGSRWEAGTVKVKGNRVWRKKNFTKRFPRTPKVFATVQSFEGRTPIAVRVRNVTRSGFEVSIQEEEKDVAGDHPKEKVGYLAVDSEQGRGIIVGGVEGSEYRLKQAKLDHRFKTVLGERIKLEEERSQDKERKHKKEAVSVLTLDDGLFAQQASDKERDTAAIRRR